MIKARAKLRVQQELIIHDEDREEDFPVIVVEVLPHLVKWERLYDGKPPVIKQQGGFSRYHNQENIYLAA
jgi:hypothetical protein